MKNPSHQVNVVRIETILPHVNADKLELIHIGGFQAVSQRARSRWADGTELATFIQELFYHWVPTLYEGPFDMDKIIPLVDGQSTRGKHIREGVIVRPLQERSIRGLGRVILKMVSNEYLSKS